MNKNQVQNQHKHRNKIWFRFFVMFSLMQHSKPTAPNHNKNLIHYACILYFFQNLHLNQFPESVHSRTNPPTIDWISWVFFTMTNTNKSTQVLIVQYLQKFKILSTNSNVNRISGVSVMITNINNSILPTINYILYFDIIINNFTTAGHYKATPTEVFKSSSENNKCSCLLNSL